MDQEINYEDLDDLTILEHIEWCYDTIDEYTLDTTDLIYD